MMARDAQAARDATTLHDLVYPEGHLQERLYSFLPLLAQYGPSLVGDLLGQVKTECPDHQFAVV
jgi:hypothetical protein